MCVCRTFVHFGLMGTMYSEELLLLHRRLLNKCNIKWSWIYHNYDHLHYARPVKCVYSKFFSGVGAPILDLLLIYLSAKILIYDSYYFSIIKFLITSGEESPTRPIILVICTRLTREGVPHTKTPFLASLKLAFFVRNSITLV